MKHALTLVCLVTLAGCGAGDAPVDATAQGLTIGGGVGFFGFGWNAAWDRFDPGVVEGVPAVATDGTHWDMVYISTDGHLYDRSSTDGVTWGAPQDLGDGTFVGTPAAVYSPSGLYVAAQHWNGSVSARLRVTSTVWYDWKNVGGYVVGGGVALAATGWTVHIFGVGGDYALWEMSGAGGLWNTNWVSRGGRLAPVAPAATSWGGTRIDVIAADPSMTPWHEWQENEQLGGWESLGGKLMGTPTVASWGDHHLDFFVIGTDHAVYQKTYDGATWYDWKQLVDCANHVGATAVSPKAASPMGDSIDLYVLGMDHDAVWHDRYAHFYSSAPGPKPYCCGLAGRGCCTPSDQPQACLGQSNNAIYCNPADQRCETCGSAPGQACCTLTDSLGARPMCSYGGSGTVCNIADNQCVSSAGPAGGAYEVCKAGGVCDAGYTCVGRNVDRDIAGYCAPNPGGGGTGGVNTCVVSDYSSCCKAPSGATYCDNCHFCNSSEQCQPNYGGCVPSSGGSGSGGSGSGGSGSGGSGSGSGGSGSGEVHITGPTLAVNPAIPHTSDDVQLAWSTCNVGSKASASFGSSVKVDGTQKTTRSVPALAPGQCYPDAVSVGTTSAGAHRFEVDLDSDHKSGQATSFGDNILVNTVDVQP